MNQRSCVALYFEILHWSYWKLLHPEQYQYENCTVFSKNIPSVFALCLTLCPPTRPQEHSPFQIIHEFPIMCHYNQHPPKEDKHNIWCVMSGIDGDLLHCINALVGHVQPPPALGSRARSQACQLRSQTRSQTHRLALVIATWPLYQTTTIGLLFIIVTNMLVSQHLKTY